MTHVGRLLGTLCVYYPTQGRPHVMNDLQVEVYTAALARFTPEQLDAAGKQWMLTGKFFPALSELMGLLEPKVDASAAGHLAWACVESAIRRAGIYRGATFEDGRIGEAARLTFGSWATACNFDLDSPGWAIRRQTFLAVFSSLLPRALPPVTMGGLHRGEPLTIAALPALPIPHGTALLDDGPATHGQAVEALRRVGMLPGARPQRPTRTQAVEVCDE